MYNLHASFLLLIKDLPLAKLNDGMVNFMAIRQS
jgi:hypothetical protein